MNLRNLGFFALGALFVVANATSLQAAEPSYMGK